MKGLDTPYSIVTKCQAIKDAGYGFVIRYISPNTGNFAHKRLSAPEIAEAGKAGLWLGVVWEVMGNAAEMSTSTGAAHAKAALGALRLRGIPKSAWTYFAVDFDADKTSLAGVIAYFTEIHNAFKADGRLIGGYADEYIIQQLIAAGLIHGGWLAGASRWTGSQGAHETFTQTNASKATVAGLDVDLDELTGPMAGNPSGVGFYLPVAA